MRRLSGSRNAVTFSDSVQQHLNMYALAAGATGVGMLTLPTAEAKIVYTPTNVRIAGTYNLDLNGDGRTDFTITLKRGAKSGCSQYAALNETALPHNGAEADQNGALALYQGSRIGVADTFGQGKELMAAFVVHKTIRPPFCTSRRFGNWQQANDRYLGFKFKIHDRFHYGWARLTVHILHAGNFHFLNAMITGYAYETIAGKAIIAGKTHGPENRWDDVDSDPNATLTHPISETAQPGSLGVLALGAQGVPLWRRREEESAE